MKKIKFMLLSLALVAVVGGALAFKARYTTKICTTFAQFDAAINAYTCQVQGQNTLTCPNPIATTVAPPVEGQVPVCTTIQPAAGCGNAQHPVTCDLPTVTLIQD